MEFGKSGCGCFDFLAIRSTTDRLSQTKCSFEVVESGNTLCRKQRMEAIPKASARNEETGCPKTLLQFFKIRLPSGVLIIQPQVPSDLVTDPSLAAKYGVEWVFQWSIMVENEVSVNEVTLSNRKYSVVVLAVNPSGSGLKTGCGVGWMVGIGNGTALRVVLLSLVTSIG